MIGGRWSGKTWGVLMVVTILLLKTPNIRAAGIRKVYRTIKHTLFDDWLNVLKLFGLKEGEHYTKTISPLYIKFSNGSDIIFTGMDHPDKSKGLAGCHIAVLEELNELDLLDFETIDNGLRGKGFKHKIFGMHNPVPQIPGSKYWFQEKFGFKEMKPGKIIEFDIPDGKVCASKTTYKDNAFCPDEVKRKLESYKESNPNLYKLWTLGEYAEMKGVILDNWDIVKEVPEGVDCLGYGLDFGFSQDPAALVQIWGNSSDLWIKGHIYSTGLTNRELYDRMHLTGVKRLDEIIADSAEPKSIEDLYQYGFVNISGVKKRANYKVDMINVLKSYKIHLIEGDTDLQREFSTWCWQKDKTGKDLPKPVDGNDHYIDAMIMLLHEKLNTDQVSIIRW